MSHLGTHPCQYCLGTGRIPKKGMEWTKKEFIKEVITEEVPAGFIKAFEKKKKNVR